MNINLLGLLVLETVNHLLLIPLFSSPNQGSTLRIHCQVFIYCWKVHGHGESPHSSIRSLQALPSQYVLFLLLISIKMPLQSISNIFKNYRFRKKSLNF